MSAIGLLLQLVFSFVAFIGSLPGMFVLACGVLGFVGLPIAAKVTGIKQPANLHLWIMTSLMDRIGIVLSEHGDLLLKKMTFSDLGYEEMRFGEETKAFGDPDEALHRWMNVPFALADEVHGVLFDPRHAALGARKNHHAEKGEMTVRATDSEYETYGISKWKRGVLEFPQDVHELVHLGSVRHLVDGGERAEYPQRVEAAYEKSRIPFQTGTSATKFLMIVIALIAPFGAMWFFSSQLQGSSSGADTTVGYGGYLLLLAGSKGLAEFLEDVDWRRAIAIMALVLPLPVIFLLLAVLVNPFFAIFAAGAFTLGFLALPVFSIILSVSDLLAEKIARIYLKTGLLGYDKPVWEWTPETYRLREFRTLSNPDDVTWYGLAGSQVGFTFEPAPDSWGPEVMDRSEISQKTETVADGGKPADSNIPAGHSRLPSMTRASAFAAFVPSSLSKSSYYLNSGIAMGRFADSAIGAKSFNRLQQSKEKHGGDSAVDDKTVVYSMIGCGIFSSLLGVFVFFL